MAISSYTSILVATDGSPSSRGAVEAGLELAGPDARVTFLHVLPPSAWHTFRAGATSSIVRLDTPAHDAALREAARRAQELGVDPSLELVSGDEAESILAVANTVEADVIVIGRGRRRPKLHSVSKTILHRSKRPVFVAQTRRVA